MNYSESVLKELITISESSKCSLFEAAAEYCESHEIDQEDFISSLDKNVIDRLKMSAVEQRMIRKCVQPPISTLI